MASDCALTAVQIIRDAVRGRTDLKSGCSEWSQEVTNIPPGPARGSTHLESPPAPPRDQVAPPNTRRAQPGSAQGLCGPTPRGPDQTTHSGSHALTGLIRTPEALSLVNEVQTLSTHVPSPALLDRAGGHTQHQELHPRSHSITRLIQQSEASPTP